MFEKIFVYGTLMSGFDNDFATVLHQQVYKVVPAFITGKLYIVTNWIFPYPKAAYIPNSPLKIYGELLYLDKTIDSDTLVSLLDEYEGVDLTYPEKGEYLRKVIPVLTEKGTEQAWAYVQNHSNSNLDIIPSGDFRQYLLENK